MLASCSLGAASLMSTSTAASPLLVLLLTVELRFQRERRIVASGRLDGAVVIPTATPTGTRTTPTTTVPTTTKPPPTTTAGTTTEATTTTTTTATTTTTSANCDASYPTACIPPPPPDLDCGDIPDKNFTVLQPDPHHFDGDKDG